MDMEMCVSRPHGGMTMHVIPPCVLHTVCISRTVVNVVKN